MPPARAISAGATGFLCFDDQYFLFPGFVLISVDGRFINHSCDPNAQTQKWTVNGELRVGFFTTREVRGIINQLNKYFYKS